jgi:hypothetical protein
MAAYKACGFGGRQAGFEDCRRKFILSTCLSEGCDRGGLVR